MWSVRFVSCTDTILCHVLFAAPRSSTSSLRTPCVFAPYRRIIAAFFSPIFPPPLPPLPLQHIRNMSSDSAVVASSSDVAAAAADSAAAAASSSSAAAASAAPAVVTRVELKLSLIHI